MSAMCRKSVPLSIALLIGMFFSFGCEKAEEPKPEEQKMPLSNKRILSQAVIGSESSYSSIYNLCDNGKGSFFFRGLIDNTSTIGKLSHSGAMGWTEDLRSRALCVVPANDIGLADAMIAVGGIDFDADGYLDRGYVRLRGAGGAELSEAIATISGAEVWLNDVASIDSLHFVAVGGAYVGDSPQYPYIITFDLNPDSSLTITKQHIFEDREWQRFGQVVSDPAKVTADNFVCYTGVTRVNITGATVSAAVCAVQGHKRGGAALAVQWTVDIEQNSTLPIWIDGIMLRGSTIFAVGEGDAADKPVSGGGYFNNCFIASMSSAGALNWLKIMNLSRYSDRFNGLFVTQNVLYVAGVISNYVTTADNREYALALLSLFNPATGAAIYHLGFGSWDYSSAFNAVFAEGTTAYCGGLTNHPMSGGAYQGWYTVVDCSGVGAGVAGKLPDLLEPVGGHRSVRPPRANAPGGGREAD